MAAREYRFEIEAYTPDTIPMARLAQYMGDLAELLGEPARVHFDRVATGSVILVHHVEDEAVPKVEMRVEKAKRGEGPSEAIGAIRKINQKLREDNGTAFLACDSAEIIRFPGRQEPEPISFDAFNQQGSLDGQLIVLGGTSDPVPVHIQCRDTGVVHLCDARRTLAKALAPYYLGAEVRVYGTGRWFRDEQGNWRLERFHISGFEVLSEQPLTSAIAGLRAVSGSEWESLKDPWAELDSIRNGPRERK
jgi:hypothetical protein